MTTPFRLPPSALRELSVTHWLTTLMAPSKFGRPQAVDRGDAEAVVADDLDLAGAAGGDPGHLRRHVRLPRGNRHEVELDPGLLEDSGPNRLVRTRSPRERR